MFLLICTFLFIYEEMYSLPEIPINGKSLEYSTNISVIHRNKPKLRNKQ